MSQQAKIAAILSLLFTVIFAVMTIVLMHKKRGRQQTGHGTPHGAGGHSAGHGGGHAHHPPTAWQTFQFIVGGLIIWMDWAGGCEKAGKFWPRIMMVAFCLINLFFWRNTGTPIQYIFWGILIAIFVWLAIAGREGAKPSEWHLHAHYWDDGSEWVVGTVMSWGFLASISWFFLAVTSSEIKKEEVRQERRAEMQVAKTKATAWVWKHTSPWVKNSQTEVLVWEEGPSGKVVFKSPLTTGKVVTVSYSAGSETGIYLDTKDTSYQGVVKPLGNLKSGIPPFEGKSQMVGFGLFEGEILEGTITFTPIELKWKHREGTE